MLKYTSLAYFIPFNGVFLMVNEKFPVLWRPLFSFVYFKELNEAWNPEGGAYRKIIYASLLASLWEIQETGGVPIFFPFFQTSDMIKWTQLEIKENNFNTKKNYYLKIKDRNTKKFILFKPQQEISFSETLLQTFRIE